MIVRIIVWVLHAIQLGLLLWQIHSSTTEWIPVPMFLMFPSVNTALKQTNKQDQPTLGISMIFSSCRKKCLWNNFVYSNLIISAKLAYLCGSKLKKAVRNFVSLLDAVKTLV